MLSVKNILQLILFYNSTSFQTLINNNSELEIKFKASEDARIKNDFKVKEVTEELSSYKVLCEKLKQKIRDMSGKDSKTQDFLDSFEEVMRDEMMTMKLAFETKLKQAKEEADAKATAEIKAKQDAEARATAELKAKQEAEAKQEADRLAAELKAKQEAVAKAKVDAAMKKTTITCVKGKLSKKVTAVKPTCPAGYKKK